MNKTLAKRTRCMRLNVGLPKVFKEEIVNTASFMINRNPSSNIDFKIQEEVWSSRLVDYSSQKIFGWLAYVHVQSGEHSKLNSKSRKCVFLDFEKLLKATGFGI